MMKDTDYDVVVGLEVHVQLSTLTKAFCSCSVSFGDKPNTNVCPVCLGQPGSLPVLNKKVFEYAIRVALAFECDIQKCVKFDRKNYYYPDLPKNYQISQFDMPLAYAGHVKLTDAEGEEEKRIGITRIHIEEDAGKLVHDENGPYSFVDLNRAGTPLLEIVSEPEIESPEDAYRYLTNLKQMIEYLGISNCNMEEGSLRCDANISIKKKGAVKLGTKTEIKNLNSFKAVKEALEYESQRHIKLIDSGRQVETQTRLWDEKNNITKLMRTKEAAHDYRYFPEPDLVPFETDKEFISYVGDEMVELPFEKKRRFKESYGLPMEDIEILVNKKEIADFFEKVTGEYNEPKSSSNWIKGEIMKHLNERSCSIKELPIKASSLGKIIRMVDESVISGLSGKEVIQECIETGKTPEEIVEQRSLKQVSDEDELLSVIDEVIEQNEKPVEDFLNGKGNALSFLIGQVMRKTKGKANPKVAGKLFREKLG